MSESDTSYGSVHGAGESDREDPALQPESSSGGRIRSLLTRGLKRGASSGALASLGGGVLALRGFRRFREGARLRGVLQTSLGGILVGLGVAQGRKAMTGDDEPGSATDRGDDIDQTDVVDTAPDVGDVASTSGSESAAPDRASGDEASSVVDTAPDVDDVAEPGERSTDRASGDEAAEVVDTGPDVEDAAAAEADAESTDESESAAESAEDASATSTDEAEMESFDRLGEAAFDEDSRSLPAPQRAFNQEFLALGVEAVWGVREFDGVVVVSQFYDPIQDRTDLRYVTTSEVEDDRTVRVPDSILDHWEDLLGGGVAVESGDGLVFATSGDLESDGLLAVVPAKWTTDLFGDGE